MKIRRIVLIGLFAAICFIGTYIHIPISIGGSNSMIHLGTTAIFISAIIIGKDAGFAGAIGCALFDAMNPAFAAWILPTFIIKGLTGYFAGSIAHSHGKEGNSYGLNLFAFISGGVVSLLGYFLVNWFIFVGLEVALMKMLTSIVTTGIAIIITIPLALVIKPAVNRLQRSGVSQ